MKLKPTISLNMLGYIIDFYFNVTCICIFNHITLKCNFWKVSLNCRGPVNTEHGRILAGKLWQTICTGKCCWWGKNLVNKVVSAYAKYIS